MAVVHKLHWCPYLIGDITTKTTAPQYADFALSVPGAFYNRTIIRLRIGLELLQIVSDGMPRRLRRGEDVRSWTNPRIFVQTAGRHSYPLFAIRLWHHGTAVTAE
jgi:hypothetical protein